MGCFLACFGLSNKRKRRKTLYKVLAGNQKYGSYEALAMTEKSLVPYSDFRKIYESREQNSVKSKKKKKKKVTFDLNLQIYEPNPTAYQVLDNEEEENENTTAKSEGKNSPSILGEGSASFTKRYPPNYRYYNCSEDYEEEEDIAYEESDIDEYDYDDEFDDGYDCDDGGNDENLENDEAKVYEQNTRLKELSTDPCYSSVEEEKIRNQMEYDTIDTDRSLDNMHSVLKPVENLTQWKAIKAKAVTSSKNRRKENVSVNVSSSSSGKKTSMPLVSEASLNFSPCILESNVIQFKPLLPEIAVDASLSNWLTSPKYSVSKTTIHCQ